MNKLLQVKITSIKERVHQPWRDSIDSNLADSSRDKLYPKTNNIVSFSFDGLFSRDIAPGTIEPKDTNMAKIVNQRNKFACGITREINNPITKDGLADLLARKFNLDRRDISCEKVNKSLFKPEFHEALDGILVPFLILREEPDPAFIQTFFREAMLLQGVDLGIQLAETAKEVARSYFGIRRNFEEETKTNRLTTCPKCNSRLHVKEQRHKTHVLVTLTCPNKPWCKWGYTRVTPLTGPRTSPRLGVDHGDDPEPTKNAPSTPETPLVIQQQACPSYPSNTYYQAPHHAPWNGQRITVGEIWKGSVTGGRYQVTGFEFTEGKLQPENVIIELKHLDKSCNVMGPVTASCMLLNWERVEEMLRIGTRVELIRDISPSLPKGSPGTITEIQWKDNLPEIVTVMYDNYEQNYLAISGDTTKNSTFERYNKVL